MAAMTRNSGTGLLGSRYAAMLATTMTTSPDKVGASRAPERFSKTCNN